MAVAVNPVTCDGMVWIIGVVAFAGADAVPVPIAFIAETL